MLLSVVVVQEGIPDEYDVVCVGSLNVDVDPREQDVSGACRETYSSRHSGSNSGSRTSGGTRVAAVAVHCHVSNSCSGSQGPGVHSSRRAAAVHLQWCADAVDGVYLWVHLLLLPQQSRHRHLSSSLGEGRGWWSDRSTLCVLTKYDVTLGSIFSDVADTGTLKCVCLHNNPRVRRSPPYRCLSGVCVLVPACLPACL